MKWAGVVLVNPSIEFRLSPLGLRYFFRRSTEDIATSRLYLRLSCRCTHLVTRRRRLWQAANLFRDGLVMTVMLRTATMSRILVTVLVRGAYKRPPN